MVQNEPIAALAGLRTRTACVLGTDSAKAEAALSGLSDNRKNANRDILILKQTKAE